MNNTTPTKHLSIQAAAVAMVLSLGLLTAPAHAQNTPEPQAMTTQTRSETLSTKQQAIPLIASFMAASEMPKLNAALNRGLDAGLTVSEAKEVLVHLYAYVGFPRSLNALGEFAEGGGGAQAARYRGRRRDASPAEPFQRAINCSPSARPTRPRFPARRSRTQ